MKLSVLATEALETSLEVAQEDAEKREETEIVPVVLPDEEPLWDTETEKVLDAVPHPEVVVDGDGEIETVAQSDTVADIL